MDITCLGRKLLEPAPILLLVILVSACSTGAQQQAAQIRQVQSQTITEGRECIDSVNSKSDYDHLKTKLYLTSDPTLSPPLQYQTDNSRPTKDELADMYKYYADARPCRKIVLEGAGRVHPAILNVVVNTYAAYDKLAAEFVSGRMTWGTFNQQRYSILTEGNQRISQAQTMISSQLQNQHQFEMAQRQKAIENLQQWAYQQQVLENQRTVAAIQANGAAMASMRPITCNFNQMGPNSMTCN